MAILEGAPQNNIHQNSPAAQVEGPVINRGRLAVPYLLTDDQVQLAKISALPYLSDDRVSGLLISTPDQSFVQVRIDRPTEGTPAYAKYQELLVGHRDLTQRVLSLEHILSRPGSRKDVVEAKLAATKRVLSDVQAKLGSNITLINPDGRPYIPDQIPQPFVGVQEVALPPPLATPRSKGRGAAGTIADKRVEQKVVVEKKNHALRTALALGTMTFGALTAAIAPTADDIAAALMQPPAPPKTEPVKSAPAIVLPTSTTTPIPTIIPIYTATPSPTPSPIPTAATAEVPPVTPTVPATSTPDIDEGTTEDMRPYEVVKQTIGPTTIINEGSKYTTYPQTDKMVASGNFEVLFTLDVKSPGVDTAGANPKNTVTLDLNKGRVYLARNGSSYVMAVVGPNQVINRVVIGSDKNFPKGEFAFRFLKDRQIAQVIANGRVVGVLDISNIRLFDPDGFTLGVEAAPKAEDVFSATFAVPQGQENNIKPFVPTPVPPKPEKPPVLVIDEAKIYNDIVKTIPTVFGGNTIINAFNIADRGPNRSAVPTASIFNISKVLTIYNPTTREMSSYPTGPFEATTFKGIDSTGVDKVKKDDGSTSYVPWTRVRVNLVNGSEAYAKIYLLSTTLAVTKKVSFSEAVGVTSLSLSLSPDDLQDGDLVAFENYGGSNGFTPNGQGQLERVVNKNVLLVVDKLPPAYMR